jgi:hypothetical protein
MRKQDIREFAEKWGYVLIYSDYSKKTRSNVWTVKVPTTTFKNRSGFIRTRKILEDDNLDSLLEKTKLYFTDCQSPIKVILREQKYSHADNDKELFTISNSNFD